MVKQKVSNRPVGPFSKDRRLVETSVDGRTKIGRLFATTVSDLSDQLGGAPTPAQALLIQAAALKACRLYLLSEKLLNGDDISETSDNQALAWLNSMRLDLNALGLKHCMKDGPSFAEIIAGHVEDETDDEPASPAPDDHANGASDAPSAMQEPAE